MYVCEARVSPMITPSRYWQIWRIDSIRQGRSLSLAMAMFQQQFPELMTVKQLSIKPNKEIQALFLAWFKNNDLKIDGLGRSHAGLCLRCYVSYPIVKTCQKLANLFGGGNIFTLDELLPFVLDDDGSIPIILDAEGKSQQVVNHLGETKPTTYPLFTVEILRTFNPNLERKLSLDNWADYQTKHNPNLKQFLANRGFEYLSDWALLNKARLSQVEQLSEGDRQLVEVFHAVYRRDRRKQVRKKTGRCPDPSLAQLEEMLAKLLTKGVKIDSTQMLMQQLKQVAKLLRQYEIWSHRGSPITEPLEVLDPETGNYVSQDVADMSDYSDGTEIETGELREFLDRELLKSLIEAIEQGIGDRVATVQKSRRYAIFANQVIPGLQLLYGQGMSQREIFAKLGMSNQSQVSRILNPNELLSQVRYLTLEKLLTRILNKAQYLGVFYGQPPPEYLKNLIIQVEELIDQKIFNKAAAEMRAGNHQEMKSLYAQQLRCCLNSYHSGE